MREKLNECLHQGSFDCRNGLTAKLNLWATQEDNIGFVMHSTTNKYSKL